MKNTKGYWLYFEPYMHIALKKRSVLLYNTINGESIKVMESDLIKIAYSTQHYLNQGVVFLSQTLYAQPSMQKFIDEMREKFIGDIIDVELLPEKPIQFIPIPYLLKGTMKAKSSLEDLAREDIFSYFHFLTLQIYNQCNLSCKECSYAYNQNLNCFCRQNKGRFEIPVAQLEQIYQQIKLLPLKHIYITGGNIFAHKQFPEILKLFDDIKLKCSLGFHYLNFHEELFLSQLHGYKLEIFVNPPYQTHKIESIIHLFKKHEIDCLFRFRITSENDYEMFNSSFAAELAENTFTTEPLFTGENFEFFEKYVFLNESDIFEEPLSLRKIFANRILNSNFFGHLYLDCAGDVTSNPNNKHSLGNIANNTFYQLIANELIHNYSWKRTRTKPPCNNCLYQYLCPPPSNYEWALKCNNLCHVIND
jgi:pseudo-rSAM protein